MKCHAQEHNIMSLTRLKPGPLDKEASALAMTPATSPPQYMFERVLQNYLFGILFYKRTVKGLRLVFTSDGVGVGVVVGVVRALMT